MYLLPKIHKRLYDVPARLVMSNCERPTEKASEFLDYLLMEVMQNRLHYIKDSIDIMKKIKHLKIIPDNAILVTTDVLGLYPIIPHEVGLRALKEELRKGERKRSLAKILAK